MSIGEKGSRLRFLLIPDIKQLFVVLSFLCLSMFSYAGVCSSAFTSMQNFSERFSSFKPTPSDLFYPPQNKTEAEYLKAAKYHYWQSYSSEESMSDSKYKGYILFADPFHYGHKRISFLLGADCSHFVHRLYQLFGANYPYAKTRHFISLAQAIQNGTSLDNYYLEKPASGFPIDMPRCEWKGFVDSFTLVGEGNLEVGDVIVFPRRVGLRGSNGHMGIIWSTSPLRILHSKSRKKGIVLEELALHGVEHFVFRWNSHLNPLKANSSIKSLLNSKHLSRPFKCPAEKTKR